jgi:hypothetical protein
MEINGRRVPCDQPCAGRGANKRTHRPAWRDVA